MRAARSVDSSLTHGHREQNENIGCVKGAEMDEDTELIPLSELWKKLSPAQREEAKRQFRLLLALRKLPERPLIGQRPEASSPKKPNHRS